MDLNAAPTLDAWVNKLTKLEIDKILRREYLRQVTKRKYLDSDKGKEATRKASKKFYDKRKLINELSA